VQTAPQITNRAVLLDLGEGRYAAIAPQEMVEVLVEPRTMELADAPLHRCEFLEWRGKLLSVFDVARWQAPDAPQGGFLAVVAYQTDDVTRHGCLRLAAFPSLVSVDETQACALPDASWHGVARSCFREADAAVPVLRLSALFAG
jgi:chemotaxis signal transduction protein